MKVQIICPLSDTLSFGLGNIRENYGHDDSLPYQADVFFRDSAKTDMKEFTLVGHVWNDGWGGPSNIQPHITDGNTKRNGEILRTIENLCQQHQMYLKGLPIGKQPMSDTCDIMAEGYLNLKEKYTFKMFLYRFDDDPVTIANKGKNFSGSPKSR